MTNKDFKLKTIESWLTDKITETNYEMIDSQLSVVMQGEEDLGVLRIYLTKLSEVDAVVGNHDRFVEYYKGILKRGIRDFSEWQEWGS